MFQLEFMSLINKYYKSENEEEKKLNFENLCSLIQNQKDEYENFTQTNTFSAQTQELLRECENSIIEKTNNEKSTSNNNQEVSEKNIDPLENNENTIVYLKKYVIEWQKEYENSPKEITEKQKNIIEELINRYLPDNFKMIQYLLTMRDFTELIKFQNHLKNNLRVYYANLLTDYMQSNEYKKKNIIRRYYKNKKIYKKLKELNKYVFNHKEIMELLEKW
jgi:hypothetical protein